MFMSIFPIKLNYTNRTDILDYMHIIYLLNLKFEILMLNTIKDTKHAKKIMVNLMESKPYLNQ